jgi:hypothetical protein
MAAAMLTRFIGTPHAVNQLLRLCGADDSRADARRLHAQLASQLKQVTETSMVSERMNGRYGNDWVLEEWDDLMSGVHQVALRCAAVVTRMHWYDSFIDGGRAPLNNTVRVAAGAFTLYPFNHHGEIKKPVAAIGSERNDMYSFCTYIVDNDLLRQFCLAKNMGSLDIAATTAIIDVIYASIRTW